MTKLFGWITTLAGTFTDILSLLFLYPLSDTDLHLRARQKGFSICSASAQPASKGTSLFQLFSLASSTNSFHSNFLLQLTPLDLLPFVWCVGLEAARLRSILEAAAELDLGPGASDVCGGSEAGSFAWLGHPKNQRASVRFKGTILWVCFQGKPQG